MIVMILDQVQNKMLSSIVKHFVWKCRATYSQNPINWQQFGFANSAWIFFSCVQKIHSFFYGIGSTLKFEPIWK
jgi:hypothetical protein